MKINILGYTVAITITKSDLLSQIEKLARTYPAYGNNRLGTLVCRVKAYRELIPGTGIKEAKDWVESHFAD